MSATSVAVAAVLGFLGLCLVLGWVQTFRGRLYVLLVGLCLFALAGAALVGKGPARSGLLYAAAALFIAALVFAVRESRSKLRELRQQREALEQQMLIYLDKMRREHSAKKSQQEPPDEPRGGGL